MLRILRKLKQVAASAERSEESVEAAAAEPKGVPEAETDDEAMVAEEQKPEEVGRAGADAASVAGALFMEALQLVLNSACVEETFLWQARVDESYTEAVKQLKTTVSHTMSPHIANISPEHQDPNTTPGER